MINYISRKTLLAIGLFIITFGCMYHFFAKNNEQLRVSFDYKVLSSLDCRRHFKRDLIAKGYQPIYIKITNDTDRTYAFSMNDVSIPLISGNEVARKIKRSVVSRAVGYGFAFLILWPFAIPAIIDTINASDANKQMKADVAFKELRDQTITPHSTISGLLFALNADFKRF